MGKKKSLGHNPLAHRNRGYASFDFIAPAPTEEQGGQSPDHEEHTVNKTTASYYLEEPVINKIRSLAELQETSYSALVNKILKESLKDIYFEPEFD